MLSNLQHMQVPTILSAVDNDIQRPALTAVHTDHGNTARAGNVMSPSACPWAHPTTTMASPPHLVS